MQPDYITVQRNLLLAILHMCDGLAVAPLGVSVMPDRQLAQLHKILNFVGPELEALLNEESTFTEGTSH
jgi:hypothetical protein